MQTVGNRIYQMLIVYSGHFSDICLDRMCEYIHVTVVWNENVSFVNISSRYVIVSNIHCYESLWNHFMTKLYSQRD